MLQPTIPLPPTWPQHTKSAIVHAVALAHFVLTHVRGWCVNSRIARVRLAAECDIRREQVALLREELRIKDARMARIPARCRPHYPPAERLAILELRAARAWSVAQTARRFLLTAATIASWTRRLDEQGQAALVRVPVPVNRFPEFAGHIVQRLKSLCPTVGRKRIANTLARAGLHLAPSTARRMIERKPPLPAPRPAPTRSDSPRTVTAANPDHVWNLDLTQVPTRLGYWTPWLPHALAQRWPFGWWVFVVLDHFSRKVVGFAVFDEQPSSEQVCAALDTAVERMGKPPNYTVSDQGTQFRSVFLAWCERNRVKPRFGAVGRYGSIAVLERFMRTLKSEALRRIIVPLRLDSMRSAVGLAASWYNEHRPHEALGGATPAEVYDRLIPANQVARLEPRARYPASAPCAGVQVPIRGYVESLELRVDAYHGETHLPVVSLRDAA
jgi:putative transposase